MQILTVLQYEQQLERLDKQVKEQGTRLLITDRTRGAIIKALLRLGVRVDDAKARAQDLAARLSTLFCLNRIVYCCPDCQ